MIPSSSESEDDDGDSPEEEEKVNDSLFQQSQAQYQSVEATSDDSYIQSQSLLKWKYIFSLCRYVVLILVLLQTTSQYSETSERLFGVHSNPGSLTM